ncbi:MAG: 2-amino-4-hydroxy-6-hydroxymethyldihydropteridine diphosphokinase, partial [Planctomycetota bacterium]
MHRSLIALGANIEASSNLFHAALGRLASAPDVILDRCSQVIPTAPIGADAGAEFLNAAATIQTSLPPHELLQRLHEVENEFGRKRTIHWGPRRLDLDLILYESEVVCDDQLVVPHPACWYRRFVLQPAAEVAGDMIHPLLNESIEQLYSRLCRRPILIQIEAGSSGLDAGGIAEKLKSAVPLVGFESKDDV